MEPIERTLYDWLNSPTVIALISLFSAVLGGIGVKRYEAKHSDKKLEIDEESAFRKELREEVTELRVIVKGLITELIEQKRETAELYAENQLLKSQIEILKKQIEEYQTELYKNKKEKEGNENKGKTK